MYSKFEEISLKKLGSNIRMLRKNRGYSQESFANAVSLHRTYMGGVERGERNISVLNLLKIMHTLEVQPNELLSGC